MFFRKQYYVIFVFVGLIYSMEKDMREALTDLLSAISVP